VNPLKRLAGQTAVYGLSSIVGRLINFLLVPLYTNVFPTDDFGVITEMYTYVAFLLIVLTYGMETAFFRFSQKESSTGGNVFGTALFSLGFTSTLFIMMVVIFRHPIAEIMRYPDNVEYIVWIGIIVGLDALAAIPFARLRAENKPLRFATIKLTGIGVNISLVLFFLLFCPWALDSGPAWLHPLIEAVYDPGIGLGYVFIANLGAAGLTVLLLLPVMLRSRLVFAFPLWRRMLLYALPLLVAGLAGVVNEALDKLLLKYLLPEDIAMSQVGIYGAVYKVSIMMTIFIQAFRFAAEPFFFSQASEKNARELYAQVMKFFVVACLFIFLGVMLFMDIVQYFIGAAYREGLVVVPILLLANMFLGIYFNLSIWYKLTGQTRFGAWFAVVGALITIVLNVWWIPVFGYHGSAWATLVCYFSMASLSYYFGQKHFTIPYEVKKTLLFIGAALLVYFLSMLTRDFPQYLVYLLNLLLLLVFGGLVLAIDKFMVASLKKMFK